MVLVPFCTHVIDTDEILNIIANPFRDDSGRGELVKFTINFKSNPSLTSVVPAEMYYLSMSSLCNVSALVSAPSENVAKAIMVVSAEVVKSVVKSEK